MHASCYNQILNYFTGVALEVSVVNIGQVVKTDNLVNGRERYVDLYFSPFVGIACVVLTELFCNNDISDLDK